MVDHSVTPCCFKNIESHRLPVTSVVNKKAWMTGDIFRTWVTRLNTKMCSDKRHVLFLLDNAPSHEVSLSHDVSSSNPQQS